MASILVIDGHPDPAEGRLCHALADACAEGAAAGSHAVERIVLATLDFPPLVCARDFEEAEPPAPIRDAQAAIDRADHVVLVFPIWHGTMPWRMKAFVEQTFRPGFARERPARPGGLGAKRLTGKSVRIVATMGMPALAYRYYFRGLGLKNLSDNVLRFSGMGPVRWTLIGGVGGMTPDRFARERDRLAALSAASR